MIKISLSVKCTDKSKVSEENLIGYILRAIAGVTAGNYGIIEKYKCTREGNGTLEEYENIGTVERCRKASDKQKPQKAVSRFGHKVCPACGYIQEKGFKFCPGCGQRLEQ